MSEPQTERLWPHPDRDSKPYWDGLLEGRLLLQQCANCGEFRHYPRPMCPHCHSLNVRWQEAAGHGTVHSWTISHHAFHPAFKRDLPASYITVDLPEGVRILAPLRDSDPGELSLGAALSIGVEQLDEGLAIPTVRLV